MCHWRRKDIDFLNAFTLSVQKYYYQQWPCQNLIDIDNKVHYNEVESSFYCTVNRKQIYSLLGINLLCSCFEHQ